MAPPSTAAVTLKRALPCCLPDLLFSGFMDFIVNMAPGVIMACVACIPLLLWQFRRTLRG